METETDDSLWLDRALDIAHEAIQGTPTIEMAVISRALLRLDNRVKTLYDEIAHGDKAHRDWLRTAIEKHVNALPKKKSET